MNASETGERRDRKRKKKTRILLQVVADCEAHTKADTVDNSTLKSAPAVSIAVIHSAAHVCRRYTLKSSGRFFRGDSLRRSRV